MPLPGMYQFMAVNRSAIWHIASHHHLIEKRKSVQRFTGIKDEPYPVQLPKEAKQEKHRSRQIDKEDYFTCSQVLIRSLNNNFLSGKSKADVLSNYFYLFGNK